MQPPAEVEPMKITLKKNAYLVRSPQRRYANKNRKFFSKTNLAEKIWRDIENPSANWASPAIAVSKQGTDKLRFTVNFRAPNSKMVRV